MIRRQRLGIVMIIALGIALLINEGIGLAVAVGGLIGYLISGDE